MLRIISNLIFATSIWITRYRQIHVVKLAPEDTDLTINKSSSIYFVQVLSLWSHLLLSQSAGPSSPVCLLWLAAAFQCLSLPCIPILKDGTSHSLGSNLGALYAQDVLHWAMDSGAWNHKPFHINCPAGSNYSRLLFPRMTSNVCLWEACRHSAKVMAVPQYLVLRYTASIHKGCFAFTQQLPLPLWLISLLFLVLVSLHSPVSPHLIPFLGAKEVSGYMIWQHVGDQGLVPAPHLVHALFLIMDINLPHKESSGQLLHLPYGKTLWWNGLP